MFGLMAPVVFLLQRRLDAREAFTSFTEPEKDTIHVVVIQIVV